MSTKMIRSLNSFMCICVLRTVLLNDDPSAGAEVVESPNVNHSGFDAALFKQIRLLHGDEIPLWLSIQASANSVTPPKRLHPTANKRYQTVYKV